MKLTHLFGIGAAAIVTSAAISNAAILVPGTGVPGAPDPHAGGTLVGIQVSPITTATISGVLTSSVFVNDPANPFGPGFLSFVYTLANDPSSDTLERLNVNNFQGFLTDVGYDVTVAPADAPSTITRSPLSQEAGGLLGFNFDDAFGNPTLLAGHTSTLVVHTNATTFDFDTARVIDGSVANVLGLAPAPEPASLGILAVGGLLMLRKKR